MFHSLESQKLSKLPSLCVYQPHPLCAEPGHLRQPPVLDAAHRPLLLLRVHATCRYTTQRHRLRGVRHDHHDYGNRGIQGNWGDRG